MMSRNESDKSTHLELLPPELQCLILNSITNIKALHALLHASPRYLQVYMNCREMVLSHVVSNQITPAFVPIALNALEQRDNRKLRRDRTGPFLPQKRLTEPHEIPLKTWEKLLLFHKIVESLISGFTNSRLVALENSIYSQSPPSSPPPESPGRNLSLSQLEHARLARAFYNLDLYSNLFYDLDNVRWRVYFDAGLKRAVIFLQSLRDWELEELLCVRSYMIERLTDFLNKFEDDFMKAYLKDRPHIIWPSLHVANLPRFYQNIHLFDRNMMQDPWIESGLTRGLESLSAIFSADTLPAKFNALEYDYSPTLRMSVALRSYPGQEVTEKMKSSQISFYDTLEQPNEAWFWAIKFCGHPRISTKNEPFKGNGLNGRDTNDLQRWGYVIWDHARLKRLGILTKSPSKALASIGTAWWVKKSRITLKERTMKQEEIWSRERRSKTKLSTSSKPRPVFDWENLWFDDPPVH